MHYLTMKYQSQPKKIPTFSIGNKKKQKRLSAWFMKIKDRLQFNITWRF